MMINVEKMRRGEPEEVASSSSLSTVRNEDELERIAQAYGGDIDVRTSPPITSTSRIINGRRMESQTHSLSVGHRPRRRMKGKANYSSSTSGLFFLGGKVKSLATSVPILIPFGILCIVTVPDAALANGTVSASTYPPSLISSSLHVTMTSTSSSSSPSSTVLPSSTLKSILQNENHHHHPHSTMVMEGMPLSDEPTSGSGGQRQNHGHQQHHSCYVCLPPDKTSRESEEILSLFPEQTRQHIPDCASFGLQNKNQFEFKCPPEYVGCLLRIHGKNESRSCGKLPLNDCKTANSVELCYCTGHLCNGNRPDILFEETESDERQRSQLEDEKDERETRKIWQKGETDDEDLLGPPHQHLDIDGMQDDTGDYGSGSEPPGVIAPYTSTPKPTLIPNIRPDPRTTTPTSVSAAPGIFTSAFRLSSLVPLLIILLPVLQIWDLSQSL